MRKQQKPATGSRAMRAEKGREVAGEERPRARANADFPPRLWPERARSWRFGWMVGGRAEGRPVGSQFVTAAAELISSVSGTRAQLYSWKKQFTNSR